MKENEIEKNEEINKSEEIENNKPSKIKKLIKIFFIILILITISFYIYISKIEPKIIKINEIGIIDGNLGEEFNGFKIVHFADIHYGSTINDKEIENIVKKINNLNADVVVFTGDLLDDSINIKEENIESIKNILSKINANLKKYAVIGDKDYINKDSYLYIMNNAGFIVLENQNDLLYYKSNEPIEFVGTSSILEKEIDIDAANNLNVNDAEYFKIWLNHEPAIFDNLVEKDIHPNILLTSHTLGGLVNIPFYGDLLKQDGISNYNMPYYHKKRISMYTSNGLGTYKYHIRFNNVPSINFYRLYNK